MVLDIEELIGIDARHAPQGQRQNRRGTGGTAWRHYRTRTPPEGEVDAPLTALIIDSWFDNYLGVVSLVRVNAGSLNVGDRIRIYSTGQDYTVDEVGSIYPKRTPGTCLATGEVGYVVAGIKEILGAPVGDTITSSRQPADHPVPGFQPAKPRGFAGMFPIESGDFEDFREALAKLKLNDAALYYEPETSQALGFGFRCGFLGMLHMEIVQERLEREYDMDLIITAPTVVYEVETTSVQGCTSIIRQISPERTSRLAIREPIVRADILTPQEYLGNVISLCIEKRGEQKKLHYAGRQVSHRV